MQEIPSIVMKYHFDTTAAAEMRCTILNSWTIRAQCYKHVTNMAIEPPSVYHFDWIRLRGRNFGLDLFEFGQMRLDKILWSKLYIGYSVSCLSIIYLWFNDTNSKSDFIAGVATTRLGHVTTAAVVSCL
jgi:hypothetical protein